MTDQASQEKVSESYITDTVYFSSYNPPLNPLNIHYITVLNGFASGALPAMFSYCDLGCGDGTVLNTLASLFPDASFLGIDFNKEHIIRARRIAAEAALGNVEYLQVDFSQLDQLELPEFDFIVCYGTFSWINPVLQWKIMEFSGHHLAPSGKFVVHYAASPGKVQIGPLWHFLRVMTEEEGGESDSLERAMKGVRLLEDLRTKGALFFRQNPVALSREKSLIHQDINYIAHETLTEWQVLNHGDIAKALGVYGLTYTGSLHPYQNHLDLVMPARFHDMLARAPSVITRETLKDFITNQGLRSDIFIRSEDKLDEDVSHRLGKLCFAISGFDTKLPAVHQFPSNMNVVMGPPAQKLVDILGEQPCTYHALVSHRDLSGFSQEDIHKALMFCIAAGYAMPVKSESAYRDRLPVSIPRPALKLTEVILNENFHTHRIYDLPSLMLGQVYRIGSIMGLFLKGKLSTDVTESLEYAISEIGKLGLPVTFPHTIINNQSELKDMVEKIYQRFNTVILPRLIRYGVLM